MARYALACLTLLFTGCSLSDEEIRTMRSAAIAARGELPATFDSAEAATTYVHAPSTGGRVDQVRIGLNSFLVVFVHGSGVPVIKIAVYRRSLWHWELAAQPPRPPFSDHLSATVVGGKIVVTGRRTGKTWVLYDPSEPKTD